MRRVSGSSPLSSTIYPVVFRYQEQKPANFAGFLLFRRNFPHFCTENAPIWGAIFFFQKVCWICCGSPRRARRMRLSPGSPLPDLSPLPDRRPGSFPRQGPPAPGPLRYQCSTKGGRIHPIFVPLLSHFCPRFVPILSHFFLTRWAEVQDFQGVLPFLSEPASPGARFFAKSAFSLFRHVLPLPPPSEAPSPQGEGLGAAESRKPS